MSDTQMLEERLRRFAAGADDADWRDVLARAGETRKRGSRRLRRRSLTLALAGCAVAAAAAGVITSGVLSSSHSPGPQGRGHATANPLQWSPVELSFARDANGGLKSIDVTVNAATLGGTAEIQVVQGQLIKSRPDFSSGQVVFQEQVPMSNVSSPPSGTPGTVILSTWSGTLSPSNWNDGCQNAPYAVTVQVSPASNPTTGGVGGEGAQSGSFVCSST